MCKFSRTWALPNANTFSVKPIGELVARYLHGVSVDPFARNSGLATYTNDLNPQTTASHHMDAVEFLEKLASEGVKADVVIFDPPYSSQQVKEVYGGIGRHFGAEDNANVIRWKKERDLILKICRQGSVVLSFGWNSNGMGKGRGFVAEELLLVQHGGAHNDTICLVERLQVVQEPLAL